MTTLPRVSEASLINEAEDREKTVEDLISAAKCVRDDLVMEFTSTLTKLTDTRDIQVRYRVYMLLIHTHSDVGLHVCHMM